jgi:hypothetical protein
MHKNEKRSAGSETAAVSAIGIWCAGNLLAYPRTASTEAIAYAKTKTGYANKIISGISKFFMNVIQFVSRRERFRLPVVNARKERWNNTASYHRKI